MATEHKKGFSLAEIAVTIALIGVCALVWIKIPRIARPQQSQIAVERKYNSITIRKYHGPEVVMTYTRHVIPERYDVLKANNNTAVYDMNADGIPDIFREYKLAFSSEVFQKDFSRKEHPELFQRVDEKWNQARKELDIENRIKEELQKPLPPLEKLF